MANGQPLEHSVMESGRGDSPRQEPRPWPSMEMTMDALENIRTRRSIRKYLDKPVPEDILQQVLAAAMCAPSACNRQLVAVSRGR